MTQKDKPIVIIGAGIVGLFCAASLLREGHQVVLIDRKGAGEETSFGNLGGIQNMASTPIAMPGMFKEMPKWLTDRYGPLFIRPGYLPQALPWFWKMLKASQPAQFWKSAAALNSLNRHCVESHLELAGWAGARDLYTVPGQLYVWTKKAYFDKSLLSQEAWARTGQEIEQIDGATIDALEPAYRGAFEVGLRIPGNGYCASPYELCQSLLRACLAAGMTFIRGEVHELLTSGSEVDRIRTDRGIVEAGTVVLCAGVWSKELLRPLGYDIPVESQRGYHVTYRNPGIQQNNMLLVIDRKIAITPMKMGLRVGGTVEFAGLAAKPDYERATRLTEVMHQLVPSLSVDETTEWAGHRPCLPDSVPVIGRTNRFSNLLAAFGHGHMGLIGSAPTAKIVSDLIAGRKPFLELPPFSIERF
jgi:D-amino-acid dehydrogenase